MFQGSRAPGVQWQTRVGRAGPCQRPPEGPGLCRMSRCREAAPRRTRSRAAETSLN